MHGSNEEKKGNEMCPFNREEAVKRIKNHGWAKPQLKRIPCPRCDGRKNRTYVCPVCNDCGTIPARC